MPILPSHLEQHSTGRTGWLRAAVLGANDGLVSTASLILGVAASGADQAAVVTAGIAGLVAGAMSMAAGEYVSVSSQRDAERADIARETRELEDDPEGELEELAGIYEERGLSPQLAREVAQELSKGDVLAVLPPYGQAERIWVTVVVTVIGLIVLGAAGAKLGGAPVVRAAARVLFWGVAAMAITSLIGSLVGAAV